jgi:hypothetical protein
MGIRGMTGPEAVGVGAETGGGMVMVAVALGVTSVLPEAVGVGAEAVR